MKEVVQARQIPVINTMFISGMVYPILMDRVGRARILEQAGQELPGIQRILDSDLRELLMQHQATMSHLLLILVFLRSSTKLVGLPILIHMEQ